MVKLLLGSNALPLDEIHNYAQTTDSTHCQSTMQIDE